ncbi:hypothetical protein CCACVL1_30451 [Corchorus capsularis]|uniref:Uncharacterized protein n=1 Tax=Corchorus capsularis TaxID=210143 RepID=A0A1R3FX53_COCAP|nr:hypothetical protein CCACVL1_30451 [Corchorus capsularis]
MTEAIEKVTEKQGRLEVDPVNPGKVGPVDTISTENSES